MNDEEIKIQEFDEKKFKEKEKKKAKIYFTSFIFGIIIAIICSLFWRNISENIRWALCFLFAISSFGFLAKIFHTLKMDIKNFSKKDWLASIFYYLLTWLAFFILFINPPFYDASSPRIEVFALPQIQQENGTIFLFAQITDNSAVNNVTINISGKEYIMEKDNNSIYFYNVSYPFATYKIVAIDKNGNKGVYEGNLQYKEHLIKVDSDENLSSSSKIEIKVYKNISSEFRVYYKVNGYEINATKSGETEDYFIYSTSPIYNGWKNNSTNEVEIFVEAVHYFLNIEYKYSNTIYGGRFYLKTISDAKIGTEPSPVVEFSRPKLRTPAFELIFLLIAFAIFLRKKK